MKIMFIRLQKRESHTVGCLKKLKLSSHEAGPACGCRLGCFDRIPIEARTQILQNFNLLPSHDAQNSYLCGLISVLPVTRRSKKEGILHYDAVYKYRVLAMIDLEIKEIIICKKAFMSIHGISRKKIEYLVASLKKTGCAPVDKRGKHNSQVKLNDNVKSLIRGHINSFKGCSSHYSLHDSSKTYLPEELNVKKMHAMFLQDNQGVSVSYETYRHIFAPILTLLSAILIQIHAAFVTNSWQKQKHWKLRRRHALIQLPSVYIGPRNFESF